MAVKIYMTNLKGGTGVTTCCIGLGLSLAKAGEKTLIVDGDRYAANALNISGCTNLQTYTLADYEKGACRAKQTFVYHHHTVNLTISSSLGLKDEKFAECAVEELDGLFDYILLDKVARKRCNSAIIVTDPYSPSIKSSDACKAQLSDSGIKDISLFVNKLNGGQIINGEVMTAQEIAAILHLPLKAIIPEDLSLPVGKWKKSTLKAFKLAADTIRGKRESTCNVLKPYFGLNGYIKRKVRAKM